MTVHAGNTNSASFSATVQLGFREFLTGFHKRKVARADAARTKAKAKEKQERLNDRNDVSD